MKRFILMFTFFVFSWASASPVHVTLEFPQGIVPGQKTMFKAVVDGEGVSSVQGAPLSVIFDGRQNAMPQQIDLGKIGGKLEGSFTPSSGPYRVTVKFRANGNNYAFAADPDQFLTLPVRAGSLDVNFDTANPNSGFHLPVPLLGWLVASLILGFVALRGAKHFLF